MRDVDVENDVHQWERKAVASLLGLLTLCFTVWAGVVWTSGQDVVKEMRAIRLEDAQYRMAMERRLTILEQQQAVLAQRQGWVLESLRQIDHDKVPPQ